MTLQEFWTEHGHEQDLSPLEETRAEREPSVEMTRIKNTIEDGLNQGASTTSILSRVITTLAAVVPQWTEWAGAAKQAILSDVQQETLFDEALAKLQSRQETQFQAAVVKAHKRAELQQVTLAKLQRMNTDDLEALDALLTADTEELEKFLRRA